MTRAKAHQVFGELYQKERPPELQAKVDEIVRSTSDIFARIRRIEELEKASKPAPKPVEVKSNRLPSAYRGGGTKGGKAGAKTVSGNKRKRGASPAKSEESSGGFLSSLFGGSLAKWGSKTGTIDAGFLGLNPHLNPSVPKIFFTFEEPVVIAVLKGLRYAIGAAWEDLPPKRYNAIVKLYQFFNEFVNVALLFKRQDEPGKIAAETLKMQVLYAQLLKYPDIEKTLTGILPEWLKKVDEAAPYAATTETAMQKLINLERVKPKLTDSILALYALDRKSVMSWDELCLELRAKDPVVTEYRGPEQVMQKIQAKQSRLQDEIRVREQTIEEIEQIKKNYFDSSDSGKVDLKFLNPIVTDVVRRNHTDRAADSGFIKSQKGEPHRLLSILIRDMDLTCLYMVMGSVQLQSDGSGSATETVIFKPGLFKVAVEELGSVERQMEEFMKKYKNVNFNFQQFLNAMKTGGSGEPMMDEFLKIVVKANKVFKKFASSLRTVVENHKMALEKEKGGHLPENIARTKTLAIENLEVGARFIPLPKRIIAGNNRMHGKTIEDALEELVGNLYNYLYIFRDPELIKQLSSVPKLKSEIDAFRARLAKMKGGGR